MPSESPLQWRVPYTPGSDGTLRPHLWLNVAGPNRRSATPINGLVDTGADNSVLPLDYAEVLGYQPADLRLVRIQQVEGLVDSWVAIRPAAAVVIHGPRETFDLLPIFVPGAFNALWGRADFMRAFDILTAEREQQFTLIQRD